MSSVLYIRPSMERLIPLATQASNSSVNITLNSRQHKLNKRNDCKLNKPQHVTQQTKYGRFKIHTGDCTDAKQWQTRTLWPKGWMSEKGWVREMKAKFGPFKSLNLRLKGYSSWKSCIRAPLNLSIDLDSSTDTIIFFFQIFLSFLGDGPKKKIWGGPTNFLVGG